MSIDAMTNAGALNLLVATGGQASFPLPVPNNERPEPDGGAGRGA
jgi:hypothetical protein